LLKILTFTNNKCHRIYADRGIKMKKIITNLLIIFVCYTFAVAQEKKSPEIYKNWEIGVTAGVASFAGAYNVLIDSSFNHFNHWKIEIDMGFGASAKKNLSHVSGLDAIWNYSNPTGSWKYGTRTISDFKTEENEYNLNNEWNLMNLLSQNKLERKIYWYTKISIGTPNFRKKILANPLNEKHLTLLTIPAENSLLFRLNDLMRLNLGTQWSRVNTDHLDGLKTESINIE